MAGPLRVYPDIAGVRFADELSGPAFVPSGITIHHTADPDVDRVVRSLREQRLAYHLIIAADGTVIQTAWLNRRVDHAGAATWRGKSPNKHHIAIAVASWGRLTEEPAGVMRSWSGAVVDRGQVVARKDVFGKPARWHAATPAQEATLLAALRFFVAAGIAPADVCGHDECALPKGRKDDPGGVLSRTTGELRTLLLADRDAAKNPPTKPGPYHI